MDLKFGYKGVWKSKSNQFYQKDLVSNLLLRVLDFFWVFVIFLLVFKFKFSWFFGLLHVFQAPCINFKQTSSCKQGKLCAQHSWSSCSSPLFIILNWRKMVIDSMQYFYFLCILSITSSFSCIRASFISMNCFMDSKVLTWTSFRQFLYMFMNISRFSLSN